MAEPTTGRTNGECRGHVDGERRWSGEGMPTAEWARACRRWSGEGMPTVEREGVPTVERRGHADGGAARACR